MTATRVIDDHNDLENIGSNTHVQLDDYAFKTTYVIVSGSSPVPSSSRVLVAGSGIQIVDNGPGSTLVISSVSAGSQQISWNEIPTGMIDGINNTFQFLNAPFPTGAMMLFLNGVKQRQGIDSDYILSGSFVTFVVSNTPRSGSNIDATYPY